MKAIRNDHYTYRVTWSEDDQEYVGLCAEFPSLSWLSASPETALRGIRGLVADVVSDMKKSREVVPEPLAGRKFSGKFMVRVPPDVHRELTVEALPTDIPDSLQYDVSTMVIGDTVTLDALTPPANVKLVDDPETVIATLTPPKLQLEEEPELEEETELVGEGEEAAEGEAAEGAEAAAAGGDDDSGE